MHTAMWYGLCTGKRPLSPIQQIKLQIRAQQTDLTGNLKLGANDSLLNELAELDAQRNQLSLQQGRLLLDAAQQYVQQHSTQSCKQILRTGYFAEQLQQSEDQARLVVLGKQGQTSQDQLDAHIGSELENVVRRLHRPILITTQHFVAPTAVLIAFDGSSTMQRPIERQFFVGSITTKMLVNQQTSVLLLH